MNGRLEMLSAEDLKEPELTLVQAGSQEVHELRLTSSRLRVPSLCTALICLSACCQELPVGGCLFEAVLINFQSEQSKFIKLSPLCLKTRARAAPARAHTPAD